MKLSMLIAFKRRSKFTKMLVTIVQIIGLRMASRSANFYFMFAWCLDPWIGRRQPYFWDVSVNGATPRHTLVIFTYKVFLYN